MSPKDKIDATAKNIEGKVQSTIGELTGDTKMEAEGEQKQAEAKARHAIENIKDKAKKVID